MAILPKTDHLSRGFCELYVKQVIQSLEGAPDISNSLPFHKLLMNCLSGSHWIWSIFMEDWLPGGHQNNWPPDSAALRIADCHWVCSLEEETSLNGSKPLNFPCPWDHPFLFCLRFVLLFFKFYFKLLFDQHVFLIDLFWYNFSFVCGLLVKWMGCRRGWSWTLRLTISTIWSWCQKLFFLPLPSILHHCMANTLSQMLHIC